MTIQQAKEIDMVDYLSTIGHQPIKIKEPNYWYKSPLRDEKSPSFKVNRSLNRWFDFGDGKYGNLIDFGILYHKCSVSDLSSQAGWCRATTLTSIKRLSKAFLFERRRK